MKNQFIATKNLTRLIILFFFLTLQSCDKEGEILPDGTYVEMTYNGKSFIQRGKIFSLNGAIPSPEFSYYYYNLPQSVNGMKFVVLSASLNPKDTKEKAEHTVQINIPVGDEIKLNHEYVVAANPEKQIVQFGEPDFYSFYTYDMAYIRYYPYLQYAKSYYGNGKIVFTRIIENKNGSKDIEGNFEFTVPLENLEGASSPMTGKFKLYLKIV